MKLGSRQMYGCEPHAPSRSGLGRDPQVFTVPCHQKVLALEVRRKELVECEELVSPE